VMGASGDLDVAFSGNKYLLVWRMNSLANANNYVAGRIMNADGTYATGMFTIAEAAGRQLRPTVAWNGTTFVVAWDDQRNQRSFYDARTDIYGTRVSESGTVFDPVGFPIYVGPQGASAAILSKPNGVSFVASTRFVTEPPFDSYRINFTRMGDPTLTGDINGDGVVDTADLPILMAVLLGSDTTPAHVAASDVNQDGAVNGRDTQAFVDSISN